jgi:hypothetical protein
LVHGLLAWLLAIMLIKNVSDRRLVVIAGVVLDIDGIFILFNNDLFYQYHHTFGHSYIFGILIAITASILANDKIKVFFTALGAFTLHLIADIVGSNWVITPLYPISKYGIAGSTYFSNFTIYNVINPVVFLLSILAVITIMYKKELSPFEFISEKFDKIMVGLYVYPLKYKCETCGKKAFIECNICGKKACSNHLHSILKSKCKQCAGTQEKNN